MERMDSKIKGSRLRVVIFQRATRFSQEMKLKRRISQNCRTRADTAACGREVGWPSLASVGGPFGIRKDLFNSGRVAS